MVTATVDLVVCLALTPARSTCSTFHTEDRSSSSADTVPPLVLAGQFIVPGVRDDTLDASRASTVKGSRWKPDLRGASAGETINSRHTHGGVNLSVAEGILFGQVLVRSKVRVVAVLWVKGLAMGVLSEQVVKFVLGGSRHGGQRVWGDVLV